jgi:hypothetical protein
MWFQRRIGNRDRRRSKRPSSIVVGFRKRKRFKNRLPVRGPCLRKWSLGWRWMRRINRSAPWNVALRDSLAVLRAELFAVLRNLPRLPRQKVPEQDFWRISRSGRFLFWVEQEVWTLCPRLSLACTLIVGMIRWQNMLAVSLRSLSKHGAVLASMTPC